MKKFIYTILFFAFSLIAISACTEEEVTPSSDLQENGGTEVSEPRGPK